MTLWLDVYVEGWEPYRTEHHCMVKTSKHPQPGETLPVVVDRDNKERIDIQWDEVKTVDEIMREGSPIAPTGQPQVINLSGAGLSGDLNEQIQQAMQIAQQAMQQGERSRRPGRDRARRDHRRRAGRRAPTWSRCAWPSSSAWPPCAMPEP